MREKEVGCMVKCKGTNIQVLGGVGKAVVGAVLLPGVGALTGFAGKKGKYDSFCGHRWKAK